MAVLRDALKSASLAYQRPGAFAEVDGGEVSGPGATTVDITEPYWRVIREGAITEAEIADCLKG